MPTLELESGVQETKLGAPYRDSSMEVTTTFFAPLRPGEVSGAEARGILGELDPFTLDLSIPPAELDEEELGRGILTAEPGTLSAGVLVGSVKDAPPVSAGRRSAKVVMHYNKDQSLLQSFWRCRSMFVFWFFSVKTHFFFRK